MRYKGHRSIICGQNACSALSESTILSRMTLPVLFLSDLPMASSSHTRAEVNVEVSRITTEPGPAKTSLRITAKSTPTTMTLDCSATFLDDPVIKVNGKLIRKRGTRSSKRNQHKRIQESGAGQDFSASEFEFFSPADCTHHALATPSPGSKRSSLATSSSLCTSDPKRRCVESSSPKTPATITTTTVSSPACMTDGSEGDIVLVEKLCNPPAQGIDRGLACHLYARDPTRHPDCEATKHDSIGSIFEHIQEKHLSPEYCARCAKTFKSSAEQRKHIVARTCQLVSPLVVEGIHPDRIAALGKWQPAKGQGIEEQWREIWEILFRDGEGGQADCWVV